MTLIKDIIKSMFIKCNNCNGERNHDIDKETHCSKCFGTGKVLSDDAETLTNIIKNGNSRWL